jgi:hypothetical protein
MVKKNFVDVVNILLQQHGYSNSDSTSTTFLSKLNLSQDFSVGCKDIKEKRVQQKIAFGILLDWGSLGVKKNFSTNFSEFFQVLS